MSSTKQNKNNKVYKELKTITFKNRATATTPTETTKKS